MSAPDRAENDLPDRKLSKAVIIAVLAASMAIAGFAISSQSYWIDEATSLIVAMAKNPAEAWKYAQAVGGSTIQMPLYHIYLYVWDKVFGGNEWAMRASNIPWFFLAQLGFLVLLRERPKLALTACLFAAVSPTVWMYLDETRPYLMQYAAGCWLVAAVARRCCVSSVNASEPAIGPAASSAHTIPSAGSPSPPIELFTIGAAALLLAGSSLLGVIWAACFLAAIAWLEVSGSAASGHQRERIAVLVAGHKFLLLCFTASAVVLIAYYAWTWPMAGGGYHRAGFSPLHIPYVAYEFLGFAGYGPGKLQLRSSTGGALLGSIPSLLPLAVILGTLAIFAALQKGAHWPRRRTLVTWTLAVGVPSVIILAGLFFESYRALPRHFIPALPVVILGVSRLLCLAFAQAHLVWRVAAALLPLLWLGSALDLRWRDVHAKDDYRSATAIAAAVRGLGTGRGVAVVIFVVTNVASSVLEGGGRDQLHVSGHHNVELVHVVQR